MRCRDFGGQDDLASNPDALTARKCKNFLVIYDMPAGTRDDGDAGLDRCLIQVTDEMLSNASRGYLETTIGQRGGKRRRITMEISICDGMLMKDFIIICPLQQACPTVTLRIANATDDLKRGGQPKVFFPFFLSTPFLHRDEESFLRIHREWRKRYECRAPSVGVCGISEPDYICERFADKVIRHVSVRASRCVD